MMDKIRIHGELYRVAAAEAERYGVSLCGYLSQIITEAAKRVQVEGARYTFCDLHPLTEDFLLNTVRLEYGEHRARQVRLRLPPGVADEIKEQALVHLRQDADNIIDEKTVHAQMRRIITNLIVIYLAQRDLLL